jgi:UDP-GlcNAc:undecaprenyl-phosphate GlcNAc-1-phosphate transferase
MTQDLWLVMAWLVVSVGILNAYNFMDGINGMTAWYSLVTVGTLGVWHWQQQPAGEEPFLWFAFMALLVFSVANARQRALCFAGDVGSVSMAFIILLPLSQLITQTHSYLPVLLLAVYGIDTVLTIAQRLFQRQNIFRAHRQHLYQLLVHRLRWPHLRVSALYALTQLVINGLVVQAVDWSAAAQGWLAGGILAALASMYTALKLTYKNE